MGVKQGKEKVRKYKDIDEVLYRENRYFKGYSKFKKMMENNKEIKGIKRDMKRSSVEIEVLKNEGNPEVEAAKRERCVCILREYIKREKSKIFWIKFEIEQLEKALASLTQEERHIIECKYFEKMTWNMVELSVNEKFRQHNYITVSGLKKINNAALNKLMSVSKVKCG